MLCNLQGVSVETDYFCILMHESTDMSFEKVAL